MSIEAIYGRLNTSAAKFDEDANGKIRGLVDKLEEVLHELLVIPTMIEDAAGEIDALNDVDSNALTSATGEARATKEALETVVNELTAAKEALDETTGQLSATADAVRSWRFGG